MALQPGDQAIIEQLTGPIDTDEEPAVEQRLQRLGSPHVAALEMLQTNRAELERTPAILRGGRTGSNHVRNLEALDGAIDRLAAFITRSTTITLTAAGQTVLDLATGLPGGAPATITAITANPRRG